MLYTPADSPPKAIVIVLHGMAEHCGRYHEVRDHLLSAGFGVVLFDLPGHGPAALTHGLGHFADACGRYTVPEDIRVLIRTIANGWPDAKIAVLGHSMGSYLARLVLAGDSIGIDACVLTSTAAATWLSKAARVFADFLVRRKGPRHVSPVLNALLKRSFGKHRAGNHWLSRDDAEVDRYNADPLCGFPLTVSALGDLLYWLNRMSDRHIIDRMSRRTSYLIMSGSEYPYFDPGIIGFDSDLKRRGRDVRTIIFEGARHELFKETNRGEVFHALVAFISEISQSNQGGHDGHD